MSKRGDILDTSQLGSEKGLKYGLLYSTVLGWLDMGHAQGADIRALLSQFSAGEASGRPYYEIRYQQTMSVKAFSTGRFTLWRVKSGRTQSQIQSIALAIMMETAVAFENWQSMSFFSWYTDSGFSGEDLVSDLFGFYRVIFPRVYWGQLRIVSQQAALRRWDYYGSPGNFKNRGFRPLLFPDPAEKFLCPTPYKGHLPGFMKLVAPYTFTKGDGTVIRQSEVTGIVNAIG